MADFSRKSICSTYRTLCRRSHDTDSRLPPLLGGLTKPKAGNSRPFMVIYIGTAARLVYNGNAGSRWPHKLYDGGVRLEQPSKSEIRFIASRGRWPSQDEVIEDENKSH